MRDVAQQLRLKPSRILAPFFRVLETAQRRDRDTRGQRESADDDDGRRGAEHASDGCERRHGRDDGAQLQEVGAASGHGRRQPQQPPRHAEISIVTRT